MDLSHWLTFFVAAWAISISPGPGAVAAMSAGLNYGFKRGYFTTFGSYWASGRSCWWYPWD
jgi:homoserine/homoserine lactone efflux protein